MQALTPASGRDCAAPRIAAPGTRALAPSKSRSGRRSYEVSRCRKFRSARGQVQPARAQLVSSTTATLSSLVRNHGVRPPAEQASVDAALGYPPPPPLSEWRDRFGDSPRKGSDILVQALEREGVDVLFAYPGGASMEIHQALTRSDTISNVLCRHEQGEIFAAEGYAKVTGRVGVCIATSGPGATNLVTGLADALLDSVPMVAITGQVPRQLIGSDGFQETPIVEVSRQITKHNYLVMEVKDIARSVKEAFFLARSGRPGPVLVDIPKDVQQALHVPDWSEPMALDHYVSRLPRAPSADAIDAILRALQSSEKPVLYVGGGCVDAAQELAEFVALTDVPVAQTLMGLGSFPEQHARSLRMLGMHGTVVANAAVHEADLLLAMGVRFDDRVTGKLESFAARATIVHVDIDPAEIGKNKHAHVPVAADVKLTLQMLNQRLRSRGGGQASSSAASERRAAGAAPAASASSATPAASASCATPTSPATPRFQAWNAQLDAVREAHPLEAPQSADVILPQAAIAALYEETGGEAIVTTGVGQHQMWAAQHYLFRRPRRWVTSGGLGSMGFGLPSALGAAAAFDGRSGRPKKVVVDIDGDGSFLMNCQELATAAVESLNIKMFVLNNQHLGMVVQWEDRFYKANRGHTYLGRKDGEYQISRKVEDIYPDFVTMAKAFNVPARRILHPSELRPAIREMLATDGPYLLDVMVPHIQHVLPMIPGGGSFKDVITTGDGTVEY